MKYGNIILGIILSIIFSGLVGWTGIAEADFLDFIGMQQDENLGLEFVTSVTLSPDGKHVYTTSSGKDGIGVFSRNATTGALTFVTVYKDGVNGVVGLDNARSVTVSPDGAHVYAAGPFDDAVAVFGRNATTGALTFVERQKEGENGVDGLYGAYSVTLSPDGAHVYTAAAGDDAVAVFSRNATTGMLTFVEVQKDGVYGVDGLYYVNSVTVSPDGAHIYTASVLDAAVAIFAVRGTQNENSYLLWTK